jgi:hypothetical protein
LEEVQSLLQQAPEQIHNQVEQVLLDNIRKVSEGMDLAAQGQLSASRELKQIKAQLASAPADSPINQELLARAAELKDKINDINEAVKLTGSDTSGFDALLQATRGVAGGFSVLQGLMATFGSDSKNMEEVIKSTTAAMAILQGAQEISALLDKKSALNVYLMAQYRKLSALATKEQAVSTGVLAAAEETQIATTEGATVAQVGLNVAMDANPVGILLLGVTALVAAYELFSSKSKDASEQEVKLNQHLTETYNIAKDLQELKKFSFDFAVAGLENELSLMRARKASQDEILKKDWRSQTSKTSRQKRTRRTFQIGSKALLMAWQISA